MDKIRFEEDVGIRVERFPDARQYNGIQNDPREQK